MEVVNEMSKDQRTFYLLVKAISKGPKFFKDHPILATCHPGIMTFSRWMNTANNALRWFVSLEDSEVPADLLVVIDFTLNVYAPLWFQCVMNPTIKDASPLFFELCQRLADFPFTDDQKVVMQKKVECDSYKDFFF